VSLVVREVRMVGDHCTRWCKIRNTRVLRTECNYVSRMVITTDSVNLTVFVLECVHYAVGINLFHICFVRVGISVAVPWLRPLVAGISPRKTGFDVRSVHVRIIVDKVALGQVFLRVLPFYPVSIIPPMLHIHLHLHVALTRRAKGRRLGSFQK
jgi:hypothetical protein